MTNGGAGVAELERGRRYLELLRRTVLRLTALSDTLASPHGLTAPQFLTLLVVTRNADLKQAELVDRLDSDPNTVSGIVRRLEARGLLSRTPRSDDRRAMQLRATPTGAALAAAALKDFDRVALHLARTMPTEHANAIERWLGTIASLNLPD